VSEKEDAAYAEWVKEFEATKLATDEDKAAFKALTATPAGREIYRGYTREADYYRRLNAHAEEKKALEAEKAKFETDKAKMWGWWETTEPQVKNLQQREAAAMAKLTALQAHLASQGLDVPDLTNPAGGDTGKSRTEELEKRVAAAEQYRQLQDRALPKLLGDYGRVLKTITKEGYDIDPASVIDYAITNNMDTMGALNALTADERTKRSEADLAKRLEAAKAEGAREAMATSSNPSRVRPSAPRSESLDHLFKTKDPVNKSDYRRNAIDAIKAIVSEGSGGSAA
jgi:hypothetical protein